MDLYTAAITLFLVMDPLGNVPIFLSILKDFDARKRRRIIIRELLMSFGILITFLYLGQYLLDFLNLRQESISISGGIILFLIGIRMVFPGRHSIDDFAGGGEPFLVPLSIPLIAGPSTLAMLSLISQNQPDRMLDWTLALVIAWVATSIILLLSTQFYRIFKENGLSAMERLMGMLLIAMSVQMFLDGIAAYLK